ncbi:MAG: hypothetical protein HRU38_23940 [Saccharospirillaceae bacterium]|nr:hypothetical protein [Pseudomonadales bacterium]NRB81674.1 hypothetical protein [Saccharospirillaceae bacterium]
MKKALALALIIIIFSIFSGGSWKDDKYEIYYMDGNIVLGIKYSGTPDHHRRVEHKVIGAISNDKYVIAKQEVSENNLFKYYYIDKIKDHENLNPDEITMGPYSKQQLTELEKQFDFPSIPDEF